MALEEGKLRATLIKAVVVATKRAHSLQETESEPESGARSAIWNRAQGSEEVERVYGEDLVRWVYENPHGGRLGDWVLSRKALSRLYGAYQSSRAEPAQDRAVHPQVQHPDGRVRPGAFRLVQ